MTRLRDRLKALGYGKTDPLKDLGNFGNFGNRNEINGLAVPTGSHGSQEGDSPKLLKTKQFPKFPKFPSENQGSEIVECAPPWWRDPEAIEARFGEIAGYLEFDEGMARDAAERRARTLVEIEVAAMGHLSARIGQ